MAEAALLTRTGHCRSLIKLMLLVVSSVAAVLGQQDYQDRQQLIRDLVTSEAFRSHRPIIQAYNGEPVSELDTLLENLDTDRDAAFRIVMLIRILELTNDTSVQQRIIDSLKPIPFWLTPEEDTRVYWTENQMSMWLSSAYLLEERGVVTLGSENLRQRLVHYLTLKRDHHFFEFFSSVYFPYTLSGLLNLVDFCDDEEIQSLATKVTLKLLSTILLVTNSKGSFYAAAGRNYVAFYLEERAIAGTIWILTGLGNDPPEFLHHATSFLATSGLNVSSVIHSYDDSNGVVDTSLFVGPSLGDMMYVNRDLSFVDRVMFQWSSGAYFHPDVADDTQQLLTSYNLWDHGEFKDFTAFEGLPSWIGNAGSQLLATITRSSVLSGFHVKVFRNDQVVLSSVQDFWPGRLGYQVYPWMATTGTKTVWTQTGKVEPDWYDRPDTPSQSHLPYIEQKSNVMLLVYNAKNDIDLIQQFAPDSPLGVDDLEVALRWPSDFDEEKEIDLWKFGREGSGYIAVRRHCLDTSPIGEQIVACNDEHQTWAIIVGNSLMYTSFENFCDKIEQEAEFTAEWREEWSWSWPPYQSYYYGEIKFDGIEIGHRDRNDD